MKTLLCIIIFYFIFIVMVWAQSAGLGQEISGQVVDELTGTPLAGATVFVAKSTPLIGTTTNDQGFFQLQAIPLGRQTLEISYLGYQTFILPDLIVGSGHPIQLEIHLTEKASELGTVEVGSTESLVNPMGLVSGHSFTAEETRRFPAGVGDPLRLVTAFPGVNSADDEANEIVIRGNNPRGLLWKLEGVEIPSPNHFSAEGASSGGISMFSTQVISRSDFYTGAFAPEYGNATSGVFDIHLRNGNQQRGSYTFQAGLLGLDVAAEGPFTSNGSSSYLLNYRYSTLGLLDQIGIGVQEENESNNFQDLSFKLNFPTASTGTFSLFGLGGTSSFKEDQPGFFSEREDYDMGVIGFTHRLLLNETTALRTSLSVSGTALRDDFFREGESAFSEVANFSKSYERLSFTFFKKIKGSPSLLEAGFALSRLAYRFKEELHVPANDPPLDDFDLFDERGQSGTQQAYISWKSRIGDRWQLVGGLHYLRFNLNKEQVVEPRLGLKRHVGKGRSVTFSLGWHSRIESLEYYLSNFILPDGEQVQYNKDLGFTKSLHFVLGYDQMLPGNTTFRAELYYQHLYDVPIAIHSDNDVANAFSTLNVGEGFVNRPLANAGSGANYGLEVSLEKTMTDGFYYLLNASVYESNYTAADRVKRNTRFNGNFTSNLIVGREFKVGKTEKVNLFGLNVKANFSGNKRYSPIDLELSRMAGEAIRPLSGLYAERLPNYFRLDIQVNYRKNKPGLTSEWRLDLQNLTNRKNAIGEIFANETVQYLTTFGLVPVISYRLEW